MDEFSNSSQKGDVSDEILKAACTERLRQVRESFNLSLWISGISTIIALGGVALLWAGKVQAGAFTAAGGSLSTVCCSKLLQKANEELNSVLDRLDHPDKEN